MGSPVAPNTAHNFVEFALSQQVLRFGEFTLKSGRLSPYFFNAGLFSSGEALARLGDFYAEAIVASGLQFDCIFGPAYKGIPLGACVAVSLYKNHNRSVPFAYNRKEAKDHGEGGVLVGELKGRVLIVDDVISAGTAIRESVDLVKKSGQDVKVVGVVVALDREELFHKDFKTSAVQQVRQDFGVEVVSIATMAHLITFLREQYGESDKQELLDKIVKYRKEYGVDSAGA
uniref:orotate phosphoribosyltransferase n=1 Tax=Zooxanthella nutricula TaxID=1333877 RepID=A0A7S2JBV1_9DINO